VTPKEQEIAIKELEERVDRLRNIYEQYFLGFERLEPTVPRKDVDRRFALLRKEQIRNTALRFRFNVITQKYNTYAMHWVRICRQIEEGTYKRHVRRARARFGELSTSGPERDLSIDIDIGDFDVDTDLDEVLAEANAAAESFERPPPDTVPPPASERVAPPSVRAFVAPPSERTARGAALPPGTKPRIVLRKREDGDGPPSVRPPAASSPQFVTGNPRPSGPRVERAAPSSVGPQSVVAAVAAPSSAGQIPASSPNPSAGAQGAARIPVAAPSSNVGSAGRMPVAPQIRPVGSGGRIPAAPPGSAPRVPAAPPGSAPRVPGAAGRPPPVPPPSNPRLPVGPPSSPNLPPPAPRAPMPSYVEKDTDPGAPHARPPGTRPRAPLPLPSQSTRPAKKE
jgi:hypothetical protein